MQGTGCHKHLEEGERQKQIGNAAFFFPLRRRKASVRTLHTRAAETLASRVHTEPTWPLAPGQIRGRGGALRVIAASSLSFLTNGFIYLGRERFCSKLSWKLQVGKATKKRGERRGCLYRPKALEKEKDLKMLRKGMWLSSWPVQRRLPDLPHPRRTPGHSQGGLCPQDGHGQSSPGGPHQGPLEGEGWDTSTSKRSLPSRNVSMGVCVAGGSCVVLGDGER